MSCRIRKFKGIYSTRAFLKRTDTLSTIPYPNNLSRLFLTVKIIFILSGKGYFLGLFFTLKNKCEKCKITVKIVKITVAMLQSTIHFPQRTPQNLANIVLKVVKVTGNLATWQTFDCRVQ